MMFYRVNDHTTSCVISEQEIKDMGYQLPALYRDKDVASSFMKEICEKANEVGFHISERMQTVQTAMFPNHQLVLNFIDVNPEQDINSSIESLLTAADAVDLLGRDRLEEIYDMTGEEKVAAFQDCMKELSKEAQKTLEDNLRDEMVQEVEEEHQEQTEDAVQNDVKDSVNNKRKNKKEALNSSVQEEQNRQEQENTIPDEATDIREVQVKPVARNTKYLLQFSNLAQAADFCKHASHQAPGKLYKEKDTYYMSVDLTDFEKGSIGGFIFQADEYSDNISKDNMFITYLEEHGELIIGKEPMKVLMNM